jgi:hypothetical protein
MAKSILHLRHVYRKHLYYPTRCHSRILHLLVGLVLGAGCSKALTRRVQVSPGVERLQNPESQTRCLPHVSTDDLSGPSRQPVLEHEGLGHRGRVVREEVCHCIFDHGLQGMQFCFGFCKTNVGLVMRKYVAQAAKRRVHTLKLFC